ncbi:MAG: trypsin-like peptidase domain-containing protein [Anaerolineae bacterium]|nr:trypsin-like peptidase domain-containing protein [Anaerolineae bacterium]
MSTAERLRLRHRVRPLRQRVLSLVVLLSLVAAARCQAFASPVPTPAPSTPLAELIAFQQADAATPSLVPQAIIDSADAEYLLLTNIFERVAPSVVNIDVVVAGTATGVEDVSSGSGFVYDSAGYIITNAHVVADARDILVTYFDGRISEAEVVGVDTYSDLAVLRVEIEANHLRPVTFGDSRRIRVGERAIAIGNPFGLSTSMTVGIVSGLGRQLPSAELIGASGPGFENPSIIQVDTDINPGNSGGPLLNSHGEVIGVNTAIRTETGVFAGVGFAVPSSTVLRVIPELIADGKVEYAWLGISTLPSENGLTAAALAEPLELPVEAGVLVEYVTPGSPAAAAGLLGGMRVETVRGRDICVGGDIIIAVDGIAVETMDALVAYLVAETRPADTIRLTIIRGSQTFDIAVTLMARPDSLGRTLECGG